MAEEKNLTTTITIDGELAKSLNTAIKSAQKQLDVLEQAAADSADAFTKLSRSIGTQGDELKKAKRDYANYVLSGEESSDAAQELADKIRRLSREMRDNESAIEQAWRAADDLADSYDVVEESADAAEESVDDVGDAARDAGDGFTVMKGAAANLIADGLQAVIGKCAEAAGSLFGLADSTREFRQDMSTLTTAYDAAGFSAEQAEDTWKDLYAIFGEDDRAVEAANNIARMTDSQAELDEWVRITTGIWGTYQDALPVESLAEAAGETAKTGAVTGALADALNWSSEAAEMFAAYMSEDVTTAEDAFNAALAACSTEAERQALITETLTSLYGDAADAYNETAGSIIDANKAQADYTRNMAAMGARIEPTTTAVKEGMNGILETILALTEGADIEALADTISSGFEAVGDAIEWVFENGSKLLPVIGGLTAAFATYKAVSLAAAAAEGIKTAVLATGATTVSAATVATWALNSAIAFLTSPITIAIAAIAAITAAVIWLYQNWDTAKQKLIEFGAKVSEIWNSIAGWITNAIDTIGQYFPMFGAYLSGWWSSIQDAVEHVKAIFSGVIDFISNVFSGNWSAAWESVVGIFGNIFGALGDLLKAPLNGAISLINAVINGINSISITLPDWGILGDLAGKSFGINIPNIPMLATGGFTDGASIAGEAGTEAVISFDRSVREANLGYWAQAGRMLNATPEDAGFTLSDNSGGGTYIEMGSVNFSPHIEFKGEADKRSVIDAIRDEYPEFLDMLEEWLAERGVTVYGY